MGLGDPMGMTDGARTAIRRGRTDARGRAGFAARAAAIIVLGALAAGCAVVPEPEPVATPEPPERPSAPLLLRLAELPEDDQSCDMAVSTVWAEALDGEGVFSIQGASEGPTCLNTTLTLTLRAPNGRLLWRDELSRAQVYGFRDAETPEKMRGRLIDWITAFGALTRTTRALPDWPDGVDRPDVGEGNPFLPAQDLPREEYETVRQGRRPLYCYTASASYMNCVALSRREAEVRYLGVQTFRR